jgi:hypothetical protein
MSHFTTWDSIFKKIDNSFKEFVLLENKKRIILTGYKKLREVCGEDFLKKSSNSLVELLSPNFAPWILIKNANFGQKLWLLKDKENFNDIKERLLRNCSINSYGAEAEVEIAGDLIQKKFEVELIPRNNRKGYRNPDLKLKINNQWVFVEVTTFRTYPTKDFPMNYSEYKELRNIKKKLSGKINRKQLQLQKAPGILLVFTRSLLASDNYHLLIKAVLSILNRNKDISGAVIQHINLNNQRVNIEDINQYSFIICEIDCEGIYTINNIIVLNPDAEFPIEKDKIVRLFGKKSALR